EIRIPALRCTTRSTPAAGSYSAEPPLQHRSLLPCLHSRATRTAIRAFTPTRANSTTSRAGKTATGVRHFVRPARDGTDPPVSARRTARVPSRLEGSLQEAKLAGNGELRFYFVTMMRPCISG